MILDLRTTRIFLRPGTTDLRKAANGLTGIVQEEMQQDPLEVHKNQYSQAFRLLIYFRSALEL